MKRKIVSLLLVLCVICSAVLFAGCGGQGSTFDVVDGAIKKTSALDSADMKMVIKMDLAMQGMTLSLPIEANIKGEGLQGDSPTLNMDMSMSMLGQNMSVNMYQEGEWAYMSMMGAKYKTKVSALEGQYDYANNAGEMVQPLPEEWYKEAKITEKGGKTTVEIGINEEEFNKYYADFLDSINKATQSEIEGEIKISDAVVTVAVENGYVVNYSLKFAMTYDIEGQSATAEVDASVDYTNPGEKVTVTPPEDYKDYKELDMSSLFDYDVDENGLDLDLDEF